MLLVASAAAIDIGQAFSTSLQPYVDALVNGLIAILIGWVAWFVKEKLHVDIEAQNRAALTAFLQRQASSLIADGAVKLNGVKVEVQSQALADAANLALTAVPDAMNKFGLTPQKVSGMIIDMIPKEPSVAQAQAIAIDTANPATPSAAPSLPLGKT